MATILHLFLASALLAGVVAAPPGVTPNTTAAALRTASCPAYRCGHDVDVRYPFWLDQNGTTGTGARCGYRSLRLECRGGTPVLRLPSGDYGVSRITYGERTVRLFDLAVFGNGSCPHVAGRNLTLPPPLSLTHRDRELTFLLDCRFTGFAGDEVIPCLRSGRNDTYVFRDGRVPYQRAGLCQQAVGMPVVNPADDVVAALRTGFDLTWSAAAGGDCGACEKKGGFCGQRRATARDGWRFACFRSDDEKKKASSGGQRFKPGLIIPLALMGMILIMGFIALSLIYWGKCQVEAEQPVEDLNETSCRSVPAHSPGFSSWSESPPSPHHRSWMRIHEALSSPSSFAERGPAPLPAWAVASSSRSRCHETLSSFLERGPPPLPAWAVASSSRSRRHEAPSSLSSFVEMGPPPLPVRAVASSSRIR